MTSRRGRLVLGLGTLLALAGIAFLFLQDPDRYREELAALLSEAAGHPVELAGELELRWRPSPTLLARDVRITTPDALVNVASVQVEVESGALLARRLRAHVVQARGVQVSLSGAPVSGAATMIPDPASLPVDRLVVRDVEVRRGEALRLVLDRFELRDLASPLGPRLEVAVPAPRLAGHARLAVRGSALEISQIDLDTGLGAVTGELVLDLGGERARLRGELRANALRLSRRGSQDAALVPRLRYDPEVLATLDTDLRLRIGRLSAGWTSRRAAPSPRGPCRPIFACARRTGSRARPWRWPWTPRMPARCCGCSEPAGSSAGDVARCTRIWPRRGPARAPCSRPSRARWPSRPGT